MSDGLATHKQSESGGVIPLPILKAYTLMEASGLVKITSPIKAISTLGWEYCCSLFVQMPNLADLPSNVEFQVIISSEFPFDDIGIYMTDSTLWGFPHQELEQGKICLQAAENAPRTEQRLIVYMRWLIEWLDLASQNALLRAGENYQLPHFGSNKGKRTVLFSETDTELATWLPHLGSTGRVFFSKRHGVPGLFATRFVKQGGEHILKASWANSSSIAGTEVVGRWVLIPDICFERYRPPKTYLELSTHLSSFGINLNEILNGAWKEHNGSYYRAIILVGFPIPQIVGGSTTEIHWQPIEFWNKRAYATASKKLPKKPFPHLRSKSGDLSPYKAVHWVHTENCSAKRLFARSSWPNLVKDSKFVLFGCGAIGSKASESLVRGGVNHLDVYDREDLEFGNLCRHTLTAREIGYGKASQLASKLCTINPFLEVQSYKLAIPFTLDDHEYSTAIKEADILVDCTANVLAFEWLSLIASRYEKPLISMFINADGTALSITKSGNFKAGIEVFETLQEDIQAGNANISQEEYTSKNTELLNPIGCYHPTFPAKDHHITLLVAMAMDLIMPSIEEGYDFAAVIRIIPLKQNQQSLVELAYYQRYGILNANIPQNMEVPV